MTTVKTTGEFDDRPMSTYTGRNINSVSLELLYILKYFPSDYRCLTVLGSVSATNCGQGGAASSHVELVIHARVVRWLRPRQHKVLHIESADQNGAGRRSWSCI